MVGWCVPERLESLEAQPSLRSRRTSARRTHRPGATNAPVKALGPKEGELHRTIAELLDWVLLPPAMYTTFPAGWGALNKATAGRLKACGLKMGMPDILVLYPGVVVGIELKGRGGVLSKAQKAMHPILLDAGMRLFVCSSVKMVLESLKDVGVPMRKVRMYDDGNEISASRSSAQLA